MSIVFAAITPNTPMLLETIGKHRHAELAQTTAALQKLEQELYLAKPDVIVVIAPHTGMFEDAFTINGHDAFSSSFETFGDLVTKHTWKGIPHIAAMISHAARTREPGVRLMSQPNIEHGTTVPLVMIANKLEHIPILPIGYSKHSREEHLAFGRLLRDELSNSGKRIAIIASGHGAHTLSEESPLPQDESGAQYDEQLVRSLEADSSDQLLQIDQELLEQTDSCLYHSLLILHGAIEDLDYEWNVLSYEAPFGVGYLTAECLIQS